MFCDIIDKENLQKEGEKLRYWQKDIKDEFCANINKMHMNYLEKRSLENGELKLEECIIIRDVFEFIKNKI